MDLTKNNGSSRETLQPKEWQRLSEWIHCICVVTFDLELGQAMEVFYSFLLCAFRNLENRLKYVK